MGKPAISYLMDKQTERSLAYCPRCGEEIYRYDPVGDLGGCLVHEDCMKFEEQEFFMTAPAISFFKGGVLSERMQTGQHPWDESGRMAGKAEGQHWRF